MPTTSGPTGGGWFDLGPPAGPSPDASVSVSAGGVGTRRTDAVLAVLWAQLEQAEAIIRRVKDALRQERECVRPDLAGATGRSLAPGVGCQVAHFEPSTGGGAPSIRRGSTADRTPLHLTTGGSAWL